jgi:hypothetical protein
MDQLPHSASIAPERAAGKTCSIAGVRSVSVSAGRAVPSKAKNQLSLDIPENGNSF